MFYCFFLYVIGLHRWHVLDFPLYYIICLNYYSCLYRMSAWKARMGLFLTSLILKFGILTQKDVTYHSCDITTIRDLF
jgi:hypothetical protein